jgi:spermidine synthase
MDKVQTMATMKFSATRTPLITNRSAWPVLAGAFAVSGFAALLYQTAWMRLIATIFGTSELAVVAVLAAYMAGLGIGAWAAQRALPKIKRPLMVYATLEIGIAGIALLMPVLVEANQGLIEVLVDSGLLNAQTPGQSLTLLYLLGAFLMLLLPTALMGATLPILLQFGIASDRQIGQRTAALYALNTAGAVIGALAAAFFLLPRLGLQQTIYVGVAGNALAALLAFALRSTDPSDRQRPGASTITADALLIMILMAASGFVSFCLEVTWTRLLAHVVGGSLHAFALMLATFLSGIAIGSAIASAMTRERRTARHWLGFVQIGIAITSLASYVLVSHFIPAERSWVSLLLFCAAAMLPTTVLIGATFPLAVRAAARDAIDAPFVAGRIYASNTAGAIGGAVLAGLVLLPTLGFSGTMQLSATLSALLGITLLWKNILGSPARQTAAVVSIAVLALFISLPRPTALLSSSSLGAIQVQGIESFYRVGRSATVIAHDNAGHINLRTNGLPEASIALTGVPPLRNSQQWLGALPYFANPGAERYLVIGLGGGVALEGIPPTVPQVTIVELEETVLEANQSFEKRRKHKVLDDPRNTIIINDARSALSLSEERYDAIISQPSHPWTAGASHLYTREFMALANSRLNPGGVFLQWINTEFLSEPLLRSLAATLRAEFSYLYLFQPAPGVLEFIGSNTDLSHRWRSAPIQASIDATSAHFVDIGIMSHTDVLATFTLDDAGVAQLAGNARPNTDNRNQLATTRTPKHLRITASKLNTLLSETDVLCSIGQRTLLTETERFYIHRQWLLSGFESRSAACTVREIPALKSLIAGYALFLQNDIDASRERFRAAARYPSTSAAATYLLAKFTPGDVSLVLQQGSYELPDSARATILAWRAAQENDWLQVKQLDAEMSRSESSEVWFGDAAKLMAEWRIRQGVNSGDTAQLAVALAIIDSALATQWLDDLVVLRTGIGAVTQNTPIFYGSLQSFIALVENRLSSAKPNGRGAVIYRERTTERLRGMRNQLAAPWLEDGPQKQDVTERLENVLKNIERGSV